MWPPDRREPPEEAGGGQLGSRKSQEGLTLQREGTSMRNVDSQGQCSIRLAAIISEASWHP